MQLTSYAVWHSTQEISVIVPQSNIASEIHIVLSSGRRSISHDHYQRLQIIALRGCILTILSEFISSFHMRGAPLPVTYYFARKVQMTLGDKL